jgi:NADH:ubiquinone oxidoreductase subunit 6 (subunit J)
MIIELTAIVIDVLSIGLIVSACLALFVDEAIYSVAALSGTVLFTALIYVMNGAIYAAIFQFAMGVGTIAIFLVVPGSTTGSGISFQDALWDLRGLDVVLQALVILMVALGVGIVMYTRRKGGK